MVDFSPIYCKILKGLCRTTCSVFKKLKLLFASKIVVLQLCYVLKTVLRHWNCLLSSITKDSKDGLGSNLEKGWADFSSFNAMPAKIAMKEIIMVRAPWRNSTFDFSFITLQEYFLYGWRQWVVTYNWPKTKISSWHSPFNLEFHKKCLCDCLSVF